jgi:hypothetical protein
MTINGGLMVIEHWNAEDVSEGNITWKRLFGAASLRDDMLGQG